MAREIKTPKVMYGFIENLNIVAEHIRNVDRSIYEDINESIELARAWAISQTEPDPINYPGEQSSKTSANQAQVSAANALASEQAAAISQTESHKSEMIATAEALTSTSYAIEPQGNYVKEYYYDEPNDSIEFNELIGTYSALHHALEAAQFDPNNFYLKTEHINESNGSADANKPIILNSNGHIDQSMLDTSSFYPVAAHDPSAGTEYPDTTGESYGAFWWVEVLANPTGSDEKGDYYEFTTDPAASIEDGEIASLLGKRIYIGDFMVWASTGWGIMAGEMNPTLYYKLDGSHALTAPLAGGGQQLKNIADGSDSTDACTMEQLNTKVSKSGDTVDGVLRIADSIDMNNNRVVRWYDSSDTRQTFLYLSASDNFVAGNNSYTTLIRGSDIIAENIVECNFEPTSSNHLANKGYVDSNFVSKSGDTMNGSLTVYNGSNFQTLKVTIDSADGSQKISGYIASWITDDGLTRYTRLVVKDENTGDESELRVHVDGQIEAYNCDYITLDRALTTKEYVDGLVAPLIVRIEQLEAKIAQLEGESDE